MNKLIEELRHQGEMNFLTPEYIRSNFEFAALQSFGVIWIEIDRRRGPRVTLTGFGQTVKLFDEYNQLRSKRKTNTSYTTQFIDMKKMEKQIGDVNVHIKGDMSNSQFAINSSDKIQKIHSGKNKGSNANRTWYQRHRDLINLIGVIAAVLALIVAYLM